MVGSEDSFAVGEVLLVQGYRLVGLPCGPIRDREIVPGRKGAGMVVAESPLAVDKVLLCSHLHAATATHLLDGDHESVCSVIDGVGAPSVSAKMSALLQIAAKVQLSGRDVNAEDIARARAAGAQDEDIHDTVLVAAAFCMFNRYVDGLAAITPRDEATYDRLGALRAHGGYVRR